MRGISIMTVIPAIFLVTLTSSILANELELIAGNNKFATDLYREISAKTSSNFLFSPFSANSVLAYLQSGARGQTAKELRSVLHLPHDQNQIERNFADLHQSLKHRPGYVFTSANKLYVQDGFNLAPNFIKSGIQAFDAELDTIDFGRGAQAAREMNQWVEEKTHNKITNLISPDKVTSVTRAILINALYFKGNWSTPFRIHSTKDKLFWNINRQSSPVKTMTMNEDQKTFNYAENVDVGAQFLELPFRGQEASMVIVLPYNKMGIRLLENNLDFVFQRQNFTKQYVNMSIPKFKLEATIDVKEILKTLGVHRAFSPGEADFGGISDHGLSVSDVIQKTFINVNEGGVEAAVSTYAGLTLLSIPSVPEVKQFHANHPFIYYIQVRGLIVFAGRVMEPWY